MMCGCAKKSLLSPPIVRKKTTFDIRVLILIISMRAATPMTVIAIIIFVSPSRLVRVLNNPSNITRDLQQQQQQQARLFLVNTRLRVLLSG